MQYFTWSLTLGKYSEKSDYVTSHPNPQKRDIRTLDKGSRLSGPETNNFSFYRAEP